MDHHAGHIVARTLLIVTVTYTAIPIILLSNYADRTQPPVACIPARRFLLRQLYAKDALTKFT